MDVTEALIEIRRLYPNQAIRNLVTLILSYPRRVIKQGAWPYCVLIRDSGITADALRSRIRRLDQRGGEGPAPVDHRRYFIVVDWPTAGREVHIFEGRDTAAQFFGGLEELGGSAQWVKRKNGDELRKLFPRSAADPNFTTYYHPYEGD